MPSNQPFESNSINRPSATYKFTEKQALTFAKLAYDPKPWANPEYANFLTNTGFKLVSSSSAILGEDNDDGYQGYIFSSSDRIVIASRGTDGNNIFAFSDLLQAATEKGRDMNFKTILANIKLLDDLRGDVVSALQTSANKIPDQFFSALQFLKANELTFKNAIHENQSVYFIGHSLGAVVSQLLQAKFIQKANYAVKWAENNLYSITFDNPGSFTILSTYFSEEVVRLANENAVVLQQAPNSINAVNKQAGTVFEIINEHYTLEECLEIKNLIACSHKLLNEFGMDERIGVGIASHSIEAFEKQINPTTENFFHLKERQTWNDDIVPLTTNTDGIALKFAHQLSKIGSTYSIFSKTSAMFEKAYELVEEIIKGPNSSNSDADL
jgi:hypothetical protein